MSQALLLSAVVTFCAPAEKTSVFRDISFEEACKVAKQDEKVVLVCFYTTWCIPCKRMDQTTWKDERVQDWLKEKTIALKLDAEEEEELAKKYRAEAFPTIVLLRPDGTEIDRLTGYVSSAEFLSDAQSGLDGKDGVTRAEEKLKGAGRNDPSLRMQYARALAQKGEHESALKEYLWCFDHGHKQSMGFSGVRLSFLVSEIARLGKAYPQATKELKVRRDAAEKAVTGKSESDEEAGGPGGMFAAMGQTLAVMELVSLNRELGESEKTLSVFRELRKRETMPDLVADIFLSEIIDLLLERKEYDEIISSVGRVDLRVEEMIQQHKATMATLARMGGEREKETRSSLERHMIEQVARYFEALVGSGKTDEARAVAREIIKFNESGDAYAILIHRAKRAGGGKIAQDLASEAEESLDEDELTRVREAIAESSDDAKP